jgi:hypothetical protein
VLKFKRKFQRQRVKLHSTCLEVRAVEHENYITCIYYIDFYIFSQPGNVRVTTSRRVRVTTVTVEKQCVLHIRSVYFLVLGIHHAIRMRRIVICGLARSKIVLLIVS